MTVYNFKINNYDYKAPAGLEGQYKDLRNGFMCVNPTFDLECYLNYIELLNIMISDWRSFGYLDLGMMPVIMGPSFMQEALRMRLLPVLSEHNVPVYSMPPVSLMYEACNLPLEDVWIFREDAAKLVGGSNKITANSFIRWCWNL